MGDLLTTVSTFAANSLENKFVAKHNSIFVIPNGIDTNKFRPKENNDTKFELDCLNFITIGRLTKYKNHQNLILAFSMLLKKLPNATLTIIGDGEEKDFLYSLINQYNLSNNIFLIGPSRNVTSYLKNANFYIHASLWEGFGLVLAEAMSSELVVISTNFDVAYEIIGNCGIYTNGFTAEDIYQSLDFASCLPISKRIELGKIARKRILNKFDISNMYLNYEKLYLSLLNS
jgi:glycosyltransferase involved in cell wall biosynthesis